MSDVINLLPDSVANQIAAGEVIQRPASVVKELVENAIDAGANNIEIHISEAGRAVIQVIDNGSGMSTTDARMAFERHATSKISNANDLFALRTMGFRGEALPSIAAVSQVIVKTRQAGNELGTVIEINGSALLKHEPVSTNTGTIFTVKNLFFNVPARRKFLKSNNTEFRHILTEFYRVALANPGIGLVLHHNNQLLHRLEACGTKKRITSLFNKNMNKSLTPIETETSIIKISGFIGKPDTAKKSSNEQYFFINGRFMKHYVFHKAVINAYRGLIPTDTTPAYFIYLSAAPDTIDINIHPTKTEIKFESEQAIFQILEAATKEAIGKANFTPAIDFETSGVIDIPTLSKAGDIKPPEIKVNPGYNPFESEDKQYHNQRRPENDNWEKLFEGFENKESGQSVIEHHPEPEVSLSTEKNFIQIGGKYIATSVKSGLMLIDQRRAHERILFERFIQSLTIQPAVTQESLFPQQFELSTDDYQLTLQLLNELSQLGFDISDKGAQTIAINGYPAEAEGNDIRVLIENILDEYKNNADTLKSDYKLNLAKSFAAASAIDCGTRLSIAEMSELFNRLFVCSDQSYTPSGKPIISIISIDELGKYLK